MSGPLDRMLPEILRAVLSYARPADALPLARCAKRWRDIMASANEAAWHQWYLADFGPYAWGDLLPWRDRYRHSWWLRLEPGKRALGLTLGVDFKASYHPVSTSSSTEGEESDGEEVPSLGSVTISDPSGEVPIQEFNIDYRVGDDDPDAETGGLDAEVYLTPDGRLDAVAVYAHDGTLFEPARPWVNRAGIYPGSTLRRVLEAYRLTIGDVDNSGGGRDGPIFTLGGVHGLHFELELFDEDDIFQEPADTWLDFPVLSFYVIPDRSSGDSSGSGDEE